MKMADVDERRARFKVLIGSAHPQGRLSPEAKVAPERNLEEMRSEDAVQEIADLFRTSTTNTVKQSSHVLRKYSRAHTALKLDKHVTFVGHQNEIRDSGREGVVDDEYAQCLYESHMTLLRMNIRKSASYVREL